MEQREANDIALRAATASRKIRESGPPGTWGPLISKEPAELRECIREYLKQHYRSIVGKGKKSGAGDAALDAIASQLQGDTSGPNRR